MNRIRVDCYSRGALMTTRVTLRGTEIDMVQLIDELSLVTDSHPLIRRLHDALRDGTGLVAAEWPPVRTS